MSAQFRDDSEDISGQIIVPAVAEVGVPVRTSGAFVPLSVDLSGNLRVNLVVGTITGTGGGQTSGAVQVSGTVAVSGSVFARGLSGIPFWEDSSGVVGVTILSGNISTTANVSGQNVYAVGLSGIPFWQDASGVVGVTLLSGASTGGGQVSGAVRVSGTVAVSGVVFAQGLSGISFWQDASGVVGVTVLSGTTSVPVTSGSVQVSGIVGVSGRVDVLSGEIHVMSGVVTSSGDAYLIAGQSGLLIPQTLSGWAHSGANVGHLGIAAIVETTTPVRLSGQLGALSTDLSGNLRVINYKDGAQVSGAVIVSGIVGVSGRVDVLSGEIHIMSGLVTVASGGNLMGRIVVGSGLVAILSGLIAVLSGEVHVMSGVVTSSGDIYQTKISGETVEAHIISGDVRVAGNSGFVVPQTLSGWAYSGADFGHLGVFPALAEGATPLRLSGQPGLLSITQSGTLRVVVINPMISGNVRILSGEIHILSGDISISGTVTILNTGFQVSGTVAVSGQVLVSGTVQVAGNSGYVVPQTLSGWSVSGAVFGHLGVAAVVESPTPTRLSGQPGALSQDMSGNLRVHDYGQGQVSGAVAVSGIVGVSGRVDILSGEIHILSGSVTTSISGQSVVVTASGIGLSGMVPRAFALASGSIASGTLGALFCAIGAFPGTGSPLTHASGQHAPIWITENGSVHVTLDTNAVTATHTDLTEISQVSGAVQVSGTVAVSGKVFAAGMSGINFWQDSSGVMGVTIISGNISTTANISGQAVLIAGNSGFLIPQTLSGWAHSGAVFGHLGIAAIVETTVPIRLSGQIGALSQDLSGNLRVVTAGGATGGGQTSGAVQVSGIVGVSGQVGILSGLIAILSGEVHVMSGVISVSGNIVGVVNPTTGRARSNVPVSSASGGDLLASGDCISITVRMLNKGSGGIINQSGIMLVGFDAAGERPYASSSGIAGYNSSYGFVLTAGDAVTYNIDNMNRMRVYAMLSGEYISYTANQL